ncbi:MAG: hypothetical protein AAF604_11875 [Acidobacteriota bacterium]
MNSKVCSAIAGQRQIRFFYKGGYRVGEPFAHGQSRDGSELVLVYQTDGHSSSGAALGWRTFRLERLWELEVLEATFDPERQGFDPFMLPMSRVCCQCSEA